MDQFISITRLSCSKGLDQLEWLNAINKAHIDPSHYTTSLIQLIISTEPFSVRLLTYYRAALNTIIDPSDAATHLIKSLPELLPRQSNLIINSISLPLINSNPKLKITHPTQSISLLKSLLDLINKLSGNDSPALTLAEILLKSITQSILSYPPNHLIQSTQLETVIQSIITTIHHSSSSSTIYQYELPSILRHLSPSAAKQLALSNNSNHPQPSSITTTASDLIAYILLNPGASALHSDQVPQTTSPIISRIISLALSQPPHSNFILELLLAAVNLGNYHPSTPLQPQSKSVATLANDDEDENDQYLENDKMSWKALLAGGRLAELIRSAVNSELLKNRQVVRLLTIPDLEILSKKIITPQKPTPSVQEQQNLTVTRIAGDTPMDIDQITTRAVEHTSRHRLCDVELGLQPLIESLGKNKHTPICELAVKLQESITTATNSFDLSTCISLTKALSSLDSVCTIFLWLQPRKLLDPLRTLLDDWNDIRNNNNQVINSSDNDESSSGSEFEKFGGLLGWLQGVVGRFGVKLDPISWIYIHLYLMSNLGYHLGSTKGFTIHYLSNPSTAYPLCSLPSTHVSTLASWVEALYGSSGIPDDLLSNTDPRVFFTISATLLKQSFDALTNGLIDLQTFRDGLSYFEHKLLIGGCAVGVVGWLLNELTRVGPISATSYPTALLEILQAILLSDSITSTALHLVSARSLALLRAFDLSFSRAPPDHLGPAADLNRRVQLDLPAIERRLTVLPASDMILPTAFLAFDFRNPEITNGQAVDWTDALRTAVRMAVDAEGDRPGPDPTVAVWSLMPHIMKAISVEEFVRMTICATIEASCTGDDHELGETAPLPSRPSRLGVRVQKAWDAAKYRRVERSIGLAVDILTWWIDGVHPFGPSPGPLRLVLDELFQHWGARLGTTADVEEAEIERDIVLGCLDRIESLELVNAQTSPKQSTLSSPGNKDQSITTDPADPQPGPQPPVEKNGQQLGINQPVPSVTDQLRQVCLESLRRQKRLSIGLVENVEHDRPLPSAPAAPRLDKAREKPQLAVVTPAVRVEGCVEVAGEMDVAGLTKEEASESNDAAGQGEGKQKEGNQETEKKAERKKENAGEKEKEREQGEESEENAADRQENGMGVDDKMEEELADGATTVEGPLGAEASGDCKPVDSLEPTIGPATDSLSVFDWIVATLKIAPLSTSSPNHHSPLTLDLPRLLLHSHPPFPLPYKLVGIIHR
ncbi:hypothetical protein VP01_2787g1 [Puccinia sorghi]|uniref:Mediator of RNA polymerase II transcription subunit 5 n=1 Tax=Puccinia sorghi TaxID=27349 RepID=A0A0L6V2N7_9BASI|nr:hypothetical protein VP01_2787g1 [Puccinia sorghi]